MPLSYQKHFVAILIILSNLFFIHSLSGQCPDTGSLAGQPCDDGLACTVDDTYDDDCICKGQQKEEEVECTTCPYSFECNQFVVTTNEQTRSVDAESEYRDFVITSDGGYAIGGGLRYNVGTNIITSTQIAKYDPSGSLLWEQILYEDNSLFAHSAKSIIETQDGALFVSGYYNSYTKLNQNGEIIYQKPPTSDAELSRNFVSATEMQDQSILLIDKAYNLVKIDLNGNEIFAKSLSDLASFKLKPFKIVSSSTDMAYLSGTIDKRATLFKLNADGEEISQYVLSDESAFHGISLDDDENLLVTGSINLAGEDLLYYAKLDQDLNVIWEYTDDQSSIGYDISTADNGNIIILCSNEPGIAVFLLNSQGVIQFRDLTTHKTIVSNDTGNSATGTFKDYFDLSTTADNGFVIVGSSGIFSRRSGAGNERAPSSVLIKGCYNLVDLSCDDNDECTSNDKYNEDCECVGERVCESICPEDDSYSVSSQADVDQFLIEYPNCTELNSLSIGLDYDFLTDEYLQYDLAPFKNLSNIENLSFFGEGLTSEADTIDFMGFESLKSISSLEFSFFGNDGGQPSLQGFLENLCIEELRIGGEVKWYSFEAFDDIGLNKIVVSGGFNKLHGFIGIENVKFKNRELFIEVNGSPSELVISSESWDLIEQSDQIDEIFITSQHAGDIMLDLSNHPALGQRLSIDLDSPDGFQLFSLINYGN